MYIYIYLICLQPNLLIMLQINLLMKQKLKTTEIFIY